MVVAFISACLQPFVAYMLYMIYRKYCEGDAGFAAGNLIGLFCSEILLLNIPGVIGMGILLWRVCAMLLRISRVGLSSAVLRACWQILPVHS